MVRGAEASIEAALLLQQAHANPARAQQLEHWNHRLDSIPEPATISPRSGGQWLQLEGEPLQQLALAAGH